MRTRPATRLAIPALLLLGCSTDARDHAPLQPRERSRRHPDRTRTSRTSSCTCRCGAATSACSTARRWPSAIEEVEDTSGDAHRRPVRRPGADQAVLRRPEWLEPDARDARADRSSAPTRSSTSASWTARGRRADRARSVPRMGRRPQARPRRQGRRRVERRAAHQQPAVAYGERCVGELGEIPFFEKTGDGEYTTYDCLESTEIPLTVTQRRRHASTKPREGTVSQCDNPQYIYYAVRGRPARRVAHERAGHALGAAVPQEHRRLRVEPVQRHRDDRAQPVHR